MNPLRLRLVVTRELEAHSQRAALNSTISSAREYRDQLKSFMAGSADAIAHVQEGIVVDANPAWLELYGLPDADAILGTPLMDAFDAEAHAAIKGALVACLQGKWSNHSLRANALLARRHERAAGDRAVARRLRGRAGRAPVRRGEEARRRQSSTNSSPTRWSATPRPARCSGASSSQQLKQALSQPIKAGMRQLVAIQPDKLDAHRR